MIRNRTKFVSDVTTDNSIVQVKAPFKLYKDKSRRYIRLEISEAVNYTVLKDSENEPHTEADGPEYTGQILNLSPGGALIESDYPAEDGALLLLKMSLQEIETLENVVGLVKRCEPLEGKWMIGVEFVTRRYLNDILSAVQIDMIPGGSLSFEENIQRVLGRYISYRQTPIGEDGHEDI